MIKVNLITRIETEIVTKASLRNEVEYWSLPEMPRIIGTDDILLTEEVKINCVPIVQLCSGAGKPDVYVAYSIEAEQLLGIPIRAILRTSELAETAAAAYKEDLDNIKALSFWNRISFVLGLRYNK